MWRCRSLQVPEYHYIKRFYAQATPPIQTSVMVIAPICEFALTVLQQFHLIPFWVGRHPPTRADQRIYVPQSRSTLCFADVAPPIATTTAVPIATAAMVHPFQAGGYLLSPVAAGVRSVVLHAAQIWCFDRR